MSVLKTRSRVVYFRVSEDEFHDFSEMCHSANARSLSDLARSAMQKMLREHTEGGSFADRLRNFDELIARMNAKLVQMDNLIQQNTPNVSRKKKANY